MARSSPPPAMLVVEPQCAPREHDNVPPAFARRATTVMHDADCRYVRALRHAVQAHTPVEVLEVEEVARIETASGIEGLPAHQHETTAHHRHRRNALACTNSLAHLVAFKPRDKQSTQRGRGKTSNSQVEQRGVALAQVLARAVRS